MNNNEQQRNMAPQNSTLINLVNDDIKSISSVERFSPIEKDSEFFNHRHTHSDTDENETDEEIPIFIGHVPRYVSGINRKTTCNDIIKALIDDELANTKASKQLICEPHNYTIYERFQDIEHALGGDELIYDLWKNWGSRTDVQFRLKINKKTTTATTTKDSDSEDDGKAKSKSKKIRNAGIQKLLKKVLLQGEMIQRHLNDMTKPPPRPQPKQKFYEKYSSNSDSDDHTMKNYSSSFPTTSRHEDSTDTEDELFLVIENHNDNDSGVFITKNERFFRGMEFDQRDNLPTTPKRKFRHSRDFGSLKDHAINHFNPHDDFGRASLRFDEIHREIRMKMNDMKQVINDESSFIRQITTHDNVDDDNKDFDNDDICDNNKTMIV